MGEGHRDTVLFLELAGEGSNFKVCLKQDAELALISSNWQNCILSEPLFPLHNIVFRCWLTHCSHWLKLRQVLRVRREAF